MQRAVERVLQTLAESTQRLTPELKATEPEIPWEQIAGLRNRLTHEYREINQEIVRRVVERELPQLESAIRRMTERAASAERAAQGEQTEEAAAEADQQSDEDKAITERAQRIHDMRVRHRDPAVRADAHVHLAALATNASVGAQMLEDAIANDGDIANDRGLSKRPRERASQMKRGEIPTAHDEALRAVEDKRIRAQARETTPSRDRTAKSDGRSTRTKQNDETRGKV